MRQLTMGGTPITVTGADLKIGQQAPDFKLLGLNFNEVKLSDFKGKILVISCVPSIDTPVCDLQTLRFNQEDALLPEELCILTVSKDLPFAQARWCGAHGINKVMMASDFRDFGFAKDYGVLLEEMGLLARAVFVIDKQGIIRAIEFVPEVGQEPDYEKVLIAIKQLI